MTAASSFDKQFNGRTLFSLVMTSLTGLCVVLAIVPLVAVLAYVIWQGGSRFSLALFTKLPPPPMVPGGGFANAIVGTITMVGLAVVISLPIGIAAAVFLSEFAPSWVARWIRFATNILNGVPSIIVGVFAYSVLVVPLKTYSAFAGAAALAVLMLPTIIRTTDEALLIVPQEIRWASVGLGASGYWTTIRVILPAAASAIITGTTLAISRAAGETAPLIFTALFTQFWSNSLLAPTASLAVLIYNFAIVPFKNQQEMAWAASFLLVILVLITSIISRLATRRH